MPRPRETIGRSRLADCVWGMRQDESHLVRPWKASAGDCVFSDPSLRESVDEVSWRRTLEPLLAGAVLRRRPRAHQAPSLRRGRLRAFGDRDPQLLTDAGADVPLGDVVSVDPSGPEVAADWDALNSPETYLGYGQTANFVSPGGMDQRRSEGLRVPRHVRRNDWALSGDWTAMAEATVLNEPKGRVAFRFDARDVHLVMGPAADASVPFSVSIDGAPPGGRRTDVDADGSGELIEPLSAGPPTGSITDRLSRSSSSMPARPSTSSHSADGLAASVPRARLVAESRFRSFPASIMGAVQHAPLIRPGRHMPAERGRHRVDVACTRPVIPYLSRMTTETEG